MAGKISVSMNGVLSAWEMAGAGRNRENMDGEKWSYSDLPVIPRSLFVSLTRIRALTWCQRKFRAQFYAHFTLSLTIFSRRQSFSSGPSK